MIPELGEMNYSVVLQTPQKKVEKGQQVTEWVDLYSTFAARRYQRGGENFSDDQKKATATHQYWIHYTNSVSEQDRLIDCETSDIMDIQGIARFREHGLIRLDCMSMPTSPQNAVRGRGQ